MSSNLVSTMQGDFCWGYDWSKQNFNKVSHRSNRCKVFQVFFVGSVFCKNCEKLFLVNNIFSVGMKKVHRCKFLQLFGKNIQCGWIQKLDPLMSRILSLLSLSLSLSLSLFLSLSHSHTLSFLFFSLLLLLPSLSRFFISHSFFLTFLLTLPALVH